MKIFENILTNPLYAFGLLGLFVFIGWVFFVKISPRTLLQWKKTDYVWLSLSAFGLFGLLANNRILLSSNYLETCNAYIELCSKDIRRVISDEYLCWKFQPYEEDDIIQKEFDSICKWRETYYNRIDSLLNEQIKVKVGELKIPSINEDALKNRIFYLTYYITEYNDCIDRKQILTANINHNECEDVLSALSPFFLIIGLSIRFTKTLGEISLQK